jgi:hypothetical protein
MKYATCQLVQGGVIRGAVHYIGQSDPIRPLCGTSSFRPCEGGAVEFLPTANLATCETCSKTTARTPLIISVATIEWVGAP